ncbi:MAG: hypothetical protein NZ734_10010 [Paracoccus sp.]|nr:hypothetical protein [Paracoccus sp. (in: a-proteobacteria)]|tara:strand:- start:1711 stop:1887 length:177 start_codon:yes stop_codon:yes gene_type:complete
MITVVSMVSGRSAGFWGSHHRHSTASRLGSETPPSYDNALAESIIGLFKTEAVSLVVV